MKNIKSPHTIFKWHKELVQVVGIAYDKVIIFRKVNAEPCKCCGEIKEYAEVESSPNFQNGAEKIETLEGKL